MANRERSPLHLNSDTADMAINSRPADVQDMSEQADGYFESLEARRLSGSIKDMLLGQRSPAQEHFDPESQDGTDRGTMPSEDEAVAAATDDRTNQALPTGTPDATRDEQDLSVREQLPTDDIDLVADAERTDAAGKVQAGKTAAEIAGTVVKNIADIPGAVASGARDAVKETRDFIQQTGDSIEATIADIAPWLPSGVVWDKKGLRVMAIKEFIDYKKDNGLQGLPDVPLLPEWDWLKTETATGAVTKSVSQFVTGFIGTGKLKYFKALKPTTRLGRAGKAMAQGAVVDTLVFDEAEGNLFDMANKYPQLAPFVSALMSKEDDAWYERRAKQALTGVVGGVVIESLMKVGRVLRSVKRAKDAKAIKETVAASEKRKIAEKMVESKKAGQPLTPQEARKAVVAEALNEQGEALRKEVGDILGQDANEKTISRLQRKSAEKLVKGANLEDAEPEFVDINWAHVATEDDVKILMQDMATEDAKAIGKRKGGHHVSWKETAASSERENAWKLIVERNIGDSANASEIDAMKNLWVASGKKLSEVMTHYNRTGTKAGHAAAAHMLGVHRMVQREFLGSAAELGRGLSILRKDVDGSRYTKALDAMLDAENSSANIKTIASKIEQMARIGDHAAVERFVHGTTGMKVQSAIKQLWINSLLSAPQTHAVNFASNLAYLPVLVAERKLAQLIGGAVGTEDAYVLGEASAMMMGTVDGMKDALIAMAKSWRGNQKATFLGPDIHDSLRQRSKYEVGQSGAFQADVHGVDPKSFVGKSMNFFDGLTQSPGKALGMADELFKSIAYRAELRATSLRKATMDAQAGRIVEGDIKSQYARYVANPSKEIKLDAADTALYATFSQAPDKYLGKVADGVRNLNGLIPALGTYNMPFRNVVINLTTANLERIPVLNMMVNSARQDLKAGGRKADMVAAKMTFGSMVLMSAMDMRMNNTIVGKAPDHPGEQSWFRRVYGGIENAISMDGGETWVSFARIEPFGSILAIGADIADIAMNTEADSEDDSQNMTDILAAVTLGIGNSITDKSVMETTMGFWQAIGDPERYGAAYLQRAAKSLAPAGVAAVERFSSPWVREAQGMLDSWRSRIPGLAADLPVRFDGNGRPVHHKSPLGDAYDFVGPALTRQYDAEPIDQEYERLDYFPQDPGKTLSYTSELGVKFAVDITRHPFAHNRYKQLAGDTVTLPQYGDKTWLDHANGIANNEPGNWQAELYWQLNTDTGKAALLRQTMKEYRDAAVGPLLEEFPELQHEDFMTRKEENTQAADSVSQQLNQQNPVGAQ